MKTVYKYILDKDGSAMMPEGGIVLKAIVIGISPEPNDVTLWVEVDTTQVMTKRWFYVYGTGWEHYRDNMVYIDTCFNGPMVWHLYEDVINE